MSGCQNCSNNNLYGSFSYPTSYSTTTCKVTTDSQCVIYTGPNLTCIGSNTNSCLQDILQNIDTKVCQAIENYSQYNFNCLANLYTIETEEEFVDAITDYACTIRTDLNTVINTTIPNLNTSLQDQIDGIVNPALTSPDFGNIPYDTSDTLDGVITTIAGSTKALFDKFGTIPTANWSSCYTVSPAPTTLVEAFNTLISQICSLKAASVTLPTFDNTGSCLASPGSTDSLVSTIAKIKTRLCLTPTYSPGTYSSTCLTVNSGTTLDQLNQLILTKIDALTQGILNQFSSDFTVTNVDNSNLCLGKRIALTSSLAVDRFVAATPSDSSPGTLQQKLTAGTNVTLDYTTTPGQVIINNSGISTVATTDTYSIDLSGSGTSGSHLTADVKISASSGNTLTINSDGLYAASASPQIYNFVETSTTKPTVTGDDVSLAVKIDTAQAGNILSYTTNGLYVPDPNSDPVILLGGASSTVNISTTPGSGNTWTISGAARVSSTATGQVLVTKSDGLAVQVSQTSGNAISINSDGIYVSSGSAQVNTDWNSTSGVSQLLNKPTISGTTNYVSKFTSSSNLGNSQIYDDGTIVVVNGTTGPSKFNVIGTSHMDYTHTYSSGTEYVLGVTGIPSFSGTLPSSNASFSSIPVEFHPTITGATTVASDTQFGAILATNFLKFTSATTLTMGGGNACAAMQATTVDDGTTNGTVDRSAGVVINGVYLVSGATATITRTNHYQLLINDTAQFGHGGNITNKFAIYQVGTSDVSRFFGPVQNASSSVQFTSDIRVKDNIVSFNKGLAEIEQMNVKEFNYIYSPDKRVTGLIAQELEQVLPEAVSQGSFDLPDGSQSFTDFRMVDQTMLFYTMINAIKELSTELKAAKSEIEILKNRG